MAEGRAHVGQGLGTWLKIERMTFVTISMPFTVAKMNLKCGLELDFRSLWIGHQLNQANQLRPILIDTCPPKLPVIVALPLSASASLSTPTRLPPLTPSCTQLPWPLLHLGCNGLPH